MFSINFLPQNIASAIDAGNIATTEHGAKTIWGINAPALLNGDFTNYDLSTGKKIKLLEIPTYIFTDEIF